MIFHTPFALDPRAESASGIRPVKMRRAFEALGFEVLEVSGRHPERRRLIGELRRRISRGLEPSFVYSEAMTAPTGFGEPITPATSFTRDIGFLRFCREAGIPVGLFYRDVYWRFQNDRVGVPASIKRRIRRARYIADLRGYETAIDRLYLPSMRMAEHLPEANRGPAAALPPGADSVDAPYGPERGISLLYVGGTGGFYRMEEAVRGVEAVAGARMTICTREGEWRGVADGYRSVIGDSTTVVHESGPGLERLYAGAHIGALLMEPGEYRGFAAPMKLYEYLGHAKPVIATRGSLAGDFVEEHGVGWAIPYDASALSRLLAGLVADPAPLEARRRRAEALRERHTWAARARQVVEDLTGSERPARPGAAAEGRRAATGVDADAEAK